MKHAFILFVLVMSAIISLSSFDKASASYVRTVFSGERSKIDFAYDFAYHIEGDCSMYVAPSVQILKPPQHGKMEPIREYGYPPEQGGFEKCNGTKVLGVASYYTPDEGFTGRDSITARFSYWNGRIDDTVFDIEVIEKPKLDPTCDAVNQAYVATRSTAWYTETTYEAKDDGALIPFFEMRISPTNGSEKYASSEKWNALDRPSTSALDRDYPKFSSCRLLDQRSSSEGNVAHYSIIWRKFPYRAESEVWISADSGRFLKLLRRYSGNGMQFSFPVALNIFDYDPKHAVAPTPLTQADDQSKQADDRPKEDLTCRAVNRAYVATRGTPSYSERIYEVKNDETLKPFGEFRITRTKGLRKAASSDEWEEYDRSSWSLFDTHSPKFSNCTLAESGQSIHYYATWHAFPYMASADIWISAESGKFLKVRRRYPDGGWQFTFPVILEIFDYDPKHAVAPNPLADDRPKEDPSCRAVNSAYVATLGTLSYSKKIYNLKKDGTRKPYADVRVTRAAGYQKYVFGERWVEFDRSAWSTFDRFGPKFTACKRIKGGKEIRYRATWHDFPFEASAEIWISAKDKRFIKVIRRYSDRWEYSFPVALEVFDYDPKNAVAPTQ